MIIFADHCVHTDVIESLVDNGFKVEKARDKGLAAAPDEDIFNYAVNHSRALLTFDKDFGNIVRFDIKRSYGIALIYIEGMDRHEIIDKVKNFFTSIKQSELRGRLFIVERERIRIWP